MHKAAYFPGRAVLANFAMLRATLALRRLPRLSLRLTTRPLASQAAGPSGVGPACFGSGLAGGMMGGLIGLGGGVVMVPLMTAFARMTQHQAVGTSSLAVAGVGLSSCASFGSAGAVDFVAAAAVATTAMVGARVGAKLTTRFDAVQLQRVFAAFQVCVAPMVPAKAYLVQRAKASEQEATGEIVGKAPASAPVAPVAPVARGLEALLEPQKLWDERGAELAALTAVGMVCGVAAGLFGIGGGVVVTPALCLLTEMPYAMVLGTTLTSMVPPGLVSAATHHRLGNLVWAAAVPLCAGSACGAFGGGQLAVRMPEEPLQWLFAVFIAGMGGRKLWTLRGL